MLIGLATTAAQRLRSSAWPKQAQTLGSGRASSNAESHGRAMVEHALLLPAAISPCCSHVISSPASRHCAPSTGLGQALGPIVCSSFQHPRSSSSSPAGCLHDSLSTAKHALINPASMPARAAVLCRHINKLPRACLASPSSWGSGWMQQSCSRGRKVSSAPTAELKVPRRSNTPWHTCSLYCKLQAADGQPWRLTVSELACCCSMLR